MRLLKSRSGPTLADDAADVRLRTIASRGKAERPPVQHYPVAQDLPKPVGARRLFWTPQEASALGE